MGTSNFYNKNASNVFASEVEEEFDYDNLIENLSYGLEEKFGKDYCKQEKYEDGLRSFSGKIVASIAGGYKYYSGINLEITIGLDVIVRSGYYSGVNVDWELNIEIENDVFKKDEEIDLSFYVDSEAQESRYAPWVKAYIEKASNELTKKVESVFSLYTTSLGVVGRFSSGETIYSEIA